MWSFSTLLSVILAASASASPAFHIPLSRLERTGPYLKGAPDADRSRAAFLKNRAVTGLDSAPASNLEYAQYTTNVAIGNPPTYFNLVVDTSSANTICGTNTPYNQTSTTVTTGNIVYVFDWHGYLWGIELLDQVTLAPGLVIANQSIGDVISDDVFPGTDGILGLGPVGLSVGTLFPNQSSTVPTVMDNLVSQRLITNKVLGVYFAPATNNNDTNGELTYGGTDPSLYVSNVTYTPVTNTWPSTMYWGINVTNVTYSNETIIPSSTAGIVDTATILLLLADDFFAMYMDAIPGASWDNTTGLLEIPLESVPAMWPLTFAIGGTPITLDISAQLIPRDQNTAWGGVPSKLYGVVGRMGSKSGQGMDFILGQKLLERYYAVFDSDNNQVGFATTNNTFSVYK